MYLFESGYADFGSRFKKHRARLWEARRSAWRWCWAGPGVRLSRLMLLLVLMSYGFAADRELPDDAFTRATTAPVRGLVGIAAVCLVAVLTVAGTVVAIGLFLPYLLLLVVLTTLSLAVFLPMRVVHGMWLVYYRITHRCPYDDCGRSKLPIHVCSCGAQYPDLVPNFYGIFHHRCRHADGSEERLPTLDLLGRKKLLRLCGACKRPVAHSSVGELPEQPILLVGAPGAGKSVFVRQAVRRLRDHLGSTHGSSVRLDSAEQERTFKDDLELLDRGQMLPKTRGDVVTAIGVAVRLKEPRGYRRLLQIFDAPGEHFESEREFGRKQILKRLGGVVLLVDPFSLPALFDLKAAGHEAAQATDTPFQQVVSSLLGVLTTHGVLERGGKCAVPLAIVLGKADALVDTPAAELAALPAAEPDDATSARCQRALVELGGGNSVRALEHGFSRIRYFVASALGRPPTAGDGRPFEPAGVDAPLLWLMGLGKTLRPE